MITYDEFENTARGTGFGKPVLSSVITNGYDWYYAKWQLREACDPERILSIYVDPGDESRNYVALEEGPELRQIAIARDLKELGTMVEPFRKRVEGFLERRTTDAISWIDRRLFEATVSNPGLMGRIPGVKDQSNAREVLTSICKHDFGSIEWDGKDSEKAIEFMNEAGLGIPAGVDEHGISCLVPSFLKQDSIYSVIIEDHLIDGDLPWLSLDVFTNTNNPVFPSIEMNLPLPFMDLPEDGLGTYESVLSGFYHMDFSDPNWCIYDERSAPAMSNFDVNKTLEEAWDDCITKSMQVLQGEYGMQDKNEER